jgi:hypothetical protein
LWFAASIEGGCFAATNSDGGVSQVVPAFLLMPQSAATLVVAVVVPPAPGHVSLLELSLDSNGNVTTTPRVHAGDRGVDAQWHAYSLRINFTQQKASLDVDGLPALTGQTLDQMQLPVGNVAIALGADLLCGDGFAGTCRVFLDDVRFDEK